MANIRDQYTSFAYKTIKDFHFTNGWLPGFGPLIIFTKQVTISSSLCKHFIPVIVYLHNDAAAVILLSILCETADSHGPNNLFHHRAKRILFPESTGQKQGYNSTTVHALQTMAGFFVTK
jgi:hypothetical protein